MALRGLQAGNFRPHQREVWKAFLTLKALGYWPDVRGPNHSDRPALRRMVESVTGLPAQTVSYILRDTSPVGCLS